MFRVNCSRCEENLFEMPSIESFGNLPTTITCSGCGKKYRVMVIDGELTVRTYGNKKSKILKVIEF